MVRFIRLTHSDSYCSFRLNTSVIAYYSKSTSSDNTFIQLLALEFINGTGDNYFIVKESVEQIDDMLGVDFE